MGLLEMDGIKVTVDQATVQRILEKEWGFSALNLGHIAEISEYVTENLSASKALAELVSDQVVAEFCCVRENDPRLARAAYMDELRASCRSTLFAAERETEEAGQARVGQETGPRDVGEPQLEQACEER